MTCGSFFLYIYKVCFKTYLCDRYGSLPTRSHFVDGFLCVALCKRQGSKLVFKNIFGSIMVLSLFIQVCYIKGLSDLCQHLVYLLLFILIYFFCLCLESCHAIQIFTLWILMIMNIRSLFIFFNLFVLGISLRFFILMTSNEVGMESERETHSFY